MTMGLGVLLGAVDVGEVGVFWDGTNGGGSGGG